MSVADTSAGATAPNAQPNVSPMASIVIVTRDRKDDLLAALESCFRQNHRPLEVLVYDDASVDGTEQAIGSRFPQVRYIRSETPIGHIALRSRGFHDARGEFVFSLDDDAYFSDPETVGKTVEMFASHPRAAAIGLPFCEPRRDKRYSVYSNQPGDVLRNFYGCAHALRAEVVRKLGCYRDFYFDRGEEKDLSIRLHDHGYDIIYGATPPVFHMASPKRDMARMSYYGVRNTLLFDFLNLPLPYMPLQVAADASRLFFHTLRLRTIPWRLYCVAGGLLACVKFARHRRPVSVATFRRFRQLPHHSPEPVSAD